MELEKCWNCGRGDVEILPGDDFVSCKCGATGPSPDKGGRMWDALSRLTYDGWAPAERAEPIPAKLETPDSGPMPWRLAIAARGMANMLSLSDYQESLKDEAPTNIDKLRAVLATADLLIGLHRATEKGGVA